MWYEWKINAAAILHILIEDLARSLLVFISKLHVNYIITLVFTMSPPQLTSTSKLPSAT
jgi:hypothetical protein